MKFGRRRISLITCVLILAAAVLPSLVSFMPVEKAGASFTAVSASHRPVSTDNATHKTRPQKSEHFSGLHSLTAGDVSAADLPGLDPAVLENINTKPARHALTAGSLEVVYVDIAIGDDSYDGSSPVILPGGIGPKKTIQAGIDAADWFSIVYVAEGIYRENIVIVDYYMDLIGAGARNTIIDGGLVDSVLLIGDCDIWIEGFTIRNGASGFAGGGVDIVESEVYFEYCTVTGNVAFFGGGVSTMMAAVIFYESAVTNNVAEIGGGGIGNLFGIITMVNSTVSGNSVGLNAMGGGGIFNGPLGMELYGVTLSNNSAPGALSRGGGFCNYISAASFFESCIVAGNTAGFPGTNNGFEEGSSFSDGYNIDSENSCDFADPTDQVNTDPKLGPLRDNGGPTDTHAITAASPAFEKGYSGDHLDWYAYRDQRNVTRPQGVYCDVGAYELEMNKRAAISAANWGGQVKFETSAGGIVDLAVSSTCPGSGSWSGATFPYGFFSFKIVGIPAGSTVQVTITFPGPISADHRYMQCDGNGHWTDITSIVGHNNGDNILVLTLKDGGTGDLDRTANGRIVDPAGPCLLPSQSPRSSASVQLPQQPVALPGLKVQSATLSSSQVTPGAPVTVQAIVANTGTVNGDMVLKLYVNGQEEDSRGVTVSSGSNTPITFNISRNEPGTYSVYVGGVSAGSFVVDNYADPAVILMISSAMLFAAFVLGMVYIYRRRSL